MDKKFFRLPATASRVHVVSRIGIPLLIVAAYVAAPNISVAHDDDDSASQVNFTPEELKRARVLFRNYCMDCHGPKMTGDEYDENLLCPDVQGNDQEEYQEAMLEGPDEMPEFQVEFMPDSTDGYLTISAEDFDLLTKHETTFNSSQP